MNWPGGAAISLSMMASPLTLWMCIEAEKATHFYLEDTDSDVVQTESWIWKKNYGYIGSFSLLTVFLPICVKKWSTTNQPQFNLVNIKGQNWKFLWAIHVTRNNDWLKGNVTWIFSFRCCQKTVNSLLDQFLTNFMLKNCSCMSVKRLKSTISLSLIVSISWLILIICLQFFNQSFGMYSESYNLWSINIT